MEISRTTLVIFVKDVFLINIKRNTGWVVGLYTLLFCVARVVFNFCKTICVNIYVCLSFTKL